MMIYSTLTSTLTQGWNFINFNPLCRTAIHALDLSYLFIRSAYSCSSKNSVEVLKSDVRECIDLSKDSNFSKYEKINNQAKDIINQVIEQCKLDSNNFEIIVNKISQSPCGIMGSLEHTDKIVLCISESFHKKLKICKKLPQQELFLIRHEIGHIVNDDPGSGLIQIERLATITNIASYILTTSILATVGFGPIISTGVGSLMGHVMAKHIRSAMWISKEQKADEFAVQNSTALQGGITLFQNEIKKNLKSRKNIEDSLSKMLLLRWDGFTLELLINYFVSDEHGNNPLDVNHPPLTERLHRLKQLAKQQGK